MKIIGKEIAKDFKSTFLSCEKDQETIWRKLFIESKPYSDTLKRLLIINAKNCLDDSQHQYYDIIKDMSLSDIRDNFVEFNLYRDKCAYKDCMHDKEKNCAVREALENGEIMKSRYENYANFIRGGK